MVWNITQVEPSWQWLYRYSLTTCTPLLLLFERAWHGSSVPLFLVLHSSLKACTHSLGKKERNVDTLNECASPWPRQQTATMLPSTKDAFKQHVLRAKFHTLIWCKSHIPNQWLIEPVGRSWSTCYDWPTMHTQPSVRLKFETWLIYTDRLTPL